ncbi:MAG: bifunctional 5,10-methylenetetrahydrofolate dehydrogenase/5,10-methenyltetrahydrofolate cyclohydrolase [Candidatus Actinomarina sp.]|nr:bifunctional 5,10-methylenetetrahydrofolate dehydrogenase/5,10-methenyltetrahydrofolate cyclohydrolase [Candidatus Actinomarina sp.]MDG1740796.1 bifunctional 5,10-methylenetetrahydrofolate dehydrogenase/5,10-methenyltetrahydrofolate cyclohydrolase [Candidatus Actinomarina sp.]|tara:strand:- start:4093 stop:4929 length:837 start_codon:yes stop_codon:yes gene_type:complete
MEKILLGKPVAELLDKKSKNAINDYIAKHNKQPLLTAITVGDNPASLLYVSRKQDKALELGVNFNWLKLSESSTSNEVKEAIEDSQIKSQGIIVQLPLPEHLDFEDIVNLIPHEVDIDGLTTHNLGYLFSENYKIIPATSLAVLELLKYYDIQTEDKNIVIAGRSRLVSSPLSKLLSNKEFNGNVTVVHSKTSDLKSYMRNADIVISAIGKSWMITADYLKPDSVVIDIGISNTDKKNYGDVNPDGLDNHLVARSPFPGGVGPITVSALFANLAKLIK